MIIREVENAISDLPVNLKSPFMLSYLGYKYEEISQIEGVPLGTVKIRIHTARKRLKERLPEYDYHNSIAA